MLLCVFASAGSQPTDFGGNPICGKYRATGNGGVIEILEMSKCASMLPPELECEYSIGERYVMVLGDNPTPDIPPGTVMGWLEPLAKSGMFSAVIFTKSKSGRLEKPKKFILRLDADGANLSMLEIKHRLRVDPLRFLPYLFHGLSLKGTLKMEDNRPDDVDGFIKFYPRPVNPRVPRAI